MPPLSARPVSATSQPVPFLDNNWATTDYGYYAEMQEVHPVGSFMATGVGVYVSPVSGQQYHGRPAFPPLGRSSGPEYETYFPRRGRGRLYDDDPFLSGSHSYRTPLDPSARSYTDPTFDEDYRRGTQTFYSSRGSDHVGPSSAGGLGVGDESRNKFDRFFGRRKHDRPDLDIPRDPDPSTRCRDGDVESLDSFEADDDRDGSPGRVHSDPHEVAFETHEVLQGYLRKFKKERAKMKRERLQFQKLKTGLEDLLYSWDETEGRRRDYESAPCSAQGPYFEHTYPRDNDPECPLTAATDPGPSFMRDPYSPVPGHTSSSGTGSPIERYNRTWKMVIAGSSSNVSNLPSVPWPTRSQRVEELSLNDGHALPLEISESQFQLRKWNAFNFLLRSFDLRATYTFDDDESFVSPDDGAVIFDIDTRGASKSKLDKLKSQLVQEKLRWHPDRMKRMRVAAFSELETETAKSVWDAILEASRACERCFAAISRL